VTYLAQKSKAQEKAPAFFGAVKEELNPAEVMAQIDRNGWDLRADDAKVYALVLSPSEEKLTHLRVNGEE